MPGQSWPAAYASFLGMWLVMMVAMMLPSFAPVLWRYRRAVCATTEAHGTTEHQGRLTALAAAGYFVVLGAVGMVAYPSGSAVAAIEMQYPGLAPMVPVAAGVIVLMAGMLQFTAWKARHLACCRGLARCREHAAHRDDRTVSAGSAWRYGLNLGLHCSCCCGGATAILLVAGVMDLRTMAVVMAGVTLERLSPAAERVARAIGFIVLGVGLVLIVRASKLLL
jgi:predicted metal-binding membrane protein